MSSKRQPPNRGSSQRDTTKRRDKSDDNGKSAAEQQMQNNLDFMAFETKIRGLIRELMDPVLKKGQTDREMILSLEKEDQSLDDRINLLEMAVYNKQSQGGKTKFDKIEDRMLEVEIQMRGQRESLQDQIDNFTSKINGYVFELDNQLLKIQNYKVQIDTNTEAIKNINQHTEEAIYDIRESLEKEKMKSLKEFQRIEARFNSIGNIIDSLPSKVLQCEVMCKNSADVASVIKKEMNEISQSQIYLQQGKTDQEIFNLFKGNMETRMIHLENNFDLTLDKTRSLENWIDIYMPLRLQHQITETVKECLSRKGKYLLGVVDNLMCQELRERVFKDVGNPQLQQRCLEVINKLHLEAKILTTENMETIRETDHNFQKWEEINNDKAAERQLQPGFVEVDVQQHLGDSDAEMVTMIKGQLEIYINKKLEDSKVWLDEKFQFFEGQTKMQLNSIESIIQSKALDSGQFQMALKEEIEEVNENVRRNNMENLILMKGFTSTLKNMKDNHRYFKENDVQTREMMQQIVEYFNHLNGLITCTVADDLRSDKDSVQGQGLNSGRIGGGVNDREKERFNQLTKAKDALQRLQISLFRNNFSNKKLKESKLGGLRDSQSNSLFQNKNGYKTTQQSRSMMGNKHRLNSPSVNSFANQAASNSNFGTAANSENKRDASGLMKIMNENNNYNKTVFLNTDQSIQEEDYMQHSKSLDITENLTNIDDRLNSIMKQQQQRLPFLQNLPKEQSPTRTLRKIKNVNPVMISTQNTVLNSAFSGDSTGPKKLHTSTHMQKGSMKLIFDDTKSIPGSKVTQGTQINSDFKNAQKSESFSPGNSMLPKIN